MVYITICQCSISTKIKWLAGYLDGDGDISKDRGYHRIECTSIEKTFMEDLKLLLHTLGCSSKYALKSGACAKVIMNTRCQAKDCYRLSISCRDLITLDRLGLKQELHRLTYEVPDSLGRDNSRFTTIDDVSESKEEVMMYSLDCNSLFVVNGIVMRG
jgi:hypothetical protein